MKIALFTAAFFSLTSLNTNAQDITLISDANDASPSSRASSNASVSMDGQCSIFQSSAALDACYEYDLQRLNVFVYDHASGTSFLANQEDGRRVGRSSDRPVIDANCSSVTFRHYPGGDNKEQLYWRELPEFPKAEPQAGSWLHLEMPVCKSLDEDSTHSYSFVEGDSLTLSSSADNVGLSVYSSTDFTEDNLVCDIFDPQSNEDICDTSSAFQQSSVLYAVVDSMRPVTDDTPALSANYTLISSGELQTKTLDVSNADFADISDDGRYIAFTNRDDNLLSNDTNNEWDIYRFDTITGNIDLVSRNSTGTSGNANSYQPSINGDGSVVGFFSSATNLGLVDQTNRRSSVYVAEFNNDGIQALENISINSEGEAFNGTSGDPKVSGDGQLVAFTTNAANVLDVDGNGEYDDFPGSVNSANVFIYDRSDASIEAVSVDDSGTLSIFQSNTPSISNDGRFISFYTSAKLHPLDTNAVNDVYVRDRELGVTAIATIDQDGGSANDSSTFSKISADGQWLVFESEASNLSSSDTNDVKDIFLADITGIHNDQNTGEAGMNNTENEDTENTQNSGGTTGESSGSAESGETGESGENDSLNDGAESTPSGGGGGCSISAGGRDLSTMAIALFAVMVLYRRRLNSQKRKHT